MRTALVCLGLLALASCGAPLQLVNSEDLRGLGSADLKSLQFSSGKKKIIFRAEADEVIKEVSKATLSTTIKFTEHRLTIPKKTPGEVARFDPISLELLLSFDPDIPALTYQDQGEGLELVTNELVIDGITYMRVLKEKRDRRGRLKPADRRFLTVKRKDKTRRERNKLKAAGVKKPKN
ncbi:MAG: hypothetical protein IIA59_01930 [Candidatus Marinimicrobia bacterium]|nr:hypothetical protein [Candidatus Neomarinimicrobiota bacterium]